MYRDALEVQPIFNSIFQQIATDSNATFTAAPMKHLSRALEKTSMKPADDTNLDRADNVCDVRRGMLVYSNFGDMVRGIEAIVAHLDIVIMRTKDRYSSPTSGGWMDLVSNIRFKSDNNAHVCEIQFIHEGLLSVRKTCGGHIAYNKFRSALEMLEVHGALETEESKAKRANTVDAGPIVLWLGQNGVKVKNDLTQVLTELNVSSVLDLASLKEAGVQKILGTMNKLQCKKWTKNDVPSKLASCLSDAIVEATSKTSVVEWLAALSLSDSGAAEWLDTNGPYEEMEDVKDLIQEEEDKQQFIVATKGKNGGEVHVVRVEQALAALLAEPDRLAREKAAKENVAQEKAAKEEEAKKNAPKCSKGHEMVHSSFAGEGYTGGYFCDKCKGRSSHGHCSGSRERWFCKPCKADICFECHPSGEKKAVPQQQQQQQQQQPSSTPGTSKVKVVVPQGVVPGQKLRVSFEGYDYDVAVPNGVPPGSKFIAILPTALAIQQKQMRAATCTKSHPLEVLGTSRDNGWTCAGMTLFPGGCKKGCTGFHQTKGWKRWRCTPCDFDLCEGCLKEKQKQAALRCPRQHPLLPYVTPTGGTCDGCREHLIAGTTVLDCRECNYWLCITCSQR